MIDLIACGQATFEVVVEHALEVGLTTFLSLVPHSCDPCQTFAAKFAYFVKAIERMDELFEPSFSTIAESGRMLSKCGKCRRYMKYIASKFV